MNIAILANGFPPELTSARLNYEMAIELNQRGHRVQVVTVLPRARYVDSSWTSSGLLFHNEAVAKGLNVLRVGVRLNLSEGLAGRALHYFLTTFWITLGAIISPRSDIILCESPPLLAGIAAYLVSKVKGARFAIRIQDIHPDVLVETGVVKNRFIISMMKSIESFAYANAALVTTISPSYRDRIISKGVPPDKVKCVPNWAVNNSSRQYPSEATGHERDFQNDFTVTYAGTMSWFQDLETVIEAANLLRDNARIHFFMIGDGAIKTQLMERARNLSLKNITFMPFQPKDVYHSIIQSSSVCLVPLKKAVTAPEMPSKLLEIMMAGRPVVANVPISSDVARVVKEAGCGTVVEPEDAEAFAKCIRWLYQNKDELKKFGMNGRDFAMAHFSLSSSIDSFEGFLKSVVQS